MHLNDTYPSSTPQEPSKNLKFRGEAAMSTLEGSSRVLVELASQDGFWPAEPASG